MNDTSNNGSGGIAAEAVSSRPAYFAMTFAPTLKLISVVRRFVESFYEQMIGNEDVSGMIALATHELLENSVRYCSDDETTVRVSIGRFGNGYLISVRTRNRALPENIERVKQIIRKIGDAEDPMALYTQMMVAAATSEEGSGLGLARIRAEADMEVEYEVTGDQLEIRATTRFETSQQEAV